MAGIQYEIRAMLPDDQEERGRLHHTAWQETYRGWVPDEYLDNHKADYYINIAKQAFDCTLIAVNEAGMLGFISWQVKRPHEKNWQDAAEITALYILKRYHRMGIGSALLAAALGQLSPKPVLLHVLEKNTQAILFYRKNGFVCTGKRKAWDTGYGTVLELEMVRHPLP